MGFKEDMDSFFERAGAAMDSADAGPALTWLRARPRPDTVLSYIEAARADKHTSLSVRVRRFNEALGCDPGIAEWLIENATEAMIKV